MQVLALSSSRVGGGGYLAEARKYITSFLRDGPLQIAFIPFASVGDYEAYGRMVRDGLSGLPYTINTVLPGTATKAIEQADVIMVGGGNTFKLLHDIYAHALFAPIRERVNQGTPYIGWSAGSNIAGKTICTTNDMPIIQPQSFQAFGFFPFQLNPHYINIVQKDFHGETRDQRLEEFVLLNPELPVIGLPEGSALMNKEGKMKYIGSTNAVLFTNRHGCCAKSELAPDTDLSEMQ
jgi:dipeptidase E